MPLPGSAFASEGSPVSLTLPPDTRSAALYRAVEHAFDAPFGAALNPLKHLGALGFLFFWLLVITGVVLYIVLDTSVEGAYKSINDLAQVPWMLGIALRGVHRYAADGFVIVMFAHLLREWMLGRFKGFRRVPWLTGVPLVALAFVSAIGGFWLNWDRLGQFSAVSTAEWLDTLPFLASPLARNFLGGVSLNARLFTLFVFVHLGVPLLMVFALWFHIQRISLARVFPPRALAWGTLAMLLMLALVLPVRSQGASFLGTSTRMRTLPSALSSMRRTRPIGKPEKVRSMPAITPSESSASKINSCCGSNTPRAYITYSKNPSTNAVTSMSKKMALRSTCAIGLGSSVRGGGVGGVEEVIASRWVKRI